MMKTISIIILDILFCVGISFAEFGLKSVIDSREINVLESPSITEVYSKVDSTYPILETFDSINTAGHWYGVSGQTTLCSHYGAICYNCYSSAYNVNDIYLYQSPNYATQFNDDGCDSIDVEFNFSYNLRPNDSLYLAYKNYSTNTVKYLTVLDTNFNINTWSSYVSVTIEPEVEWLGFQLETGDLSSGTPTNLNYVHINSLTMSCQLPPYILNVGLESFDCNSYDNYIDIYAKTTEQSNLELQHSTNGYEWTSIYTVYQSELIYEHKTTDYNNYYRITYDGNISNVIQCTAVSPNYIIKEIKYYNTLGQLINEPYGFYLESIEYENGTIRNEIKLKNN